MCFDDLYKGWNVRFTEMAKSEQDMYIRRAESISE